MTEAAPQAPDELVADKYKLTRMLGRGGMGSVWEGIHISLGTRVAVKFIESEYVDSVEARSRFENEAHAAAKLHSKHVVQVYDHGVMPDGRPYIVMEFLAGEPLDKRLDRVGRLSPHETARILHQVCRALHKAHQVGIVHRDLKPENVFLVWDDDDQADIAKVVDFGIAKFTDASMGVSSATRTGSVLGTPYFMSPEQARGLRSVDYRSDLWAVGVIAYRCMVGQLPFEGEAVGDLLVKICTSPLPVPSQASPDLPLDFDAWFTRALAREPADRFSSATELAQQLLIAVGIAPRPEMPSSMLGGPGAPQSAYGATQASPAVYGTGQQPAYHTPSTGTHQPYATPGTGSHQSFHTPATGQHPVAHVPGQGYDPAGQTAASPAGMTGAPFTQTAGERKRGAPVGAILGVLIVGLLVAGIGVAALWKFAGGGDEAAAASAPDTETASDTETAEQVEVTPAELPEVPPPPSASAAEPAAQPDEKQQPAAKPVVAASPRPKPVVAKPQPRPVQPAPQPTPRPRPRPTPVDIGY